MTVSRRTGLAVGLFFAAHLFASRVVASYAPAPPQSRILPQNGPATVQRATVSAALDDLPYVPGRLLIKFKSSVSACIDCLVDQRLPLAPALGSTLLDDLNRLHGLRSVRPLRRNDMAVKSPSKRRQLQNDRHRRLAAAAAARTGRVMPVEKFPDLTATYVLELSPWLDMEEVAREYARDPAVAYAEPDRKVHVQLVPNDHYFSSAGSWRQPFDDLWGVKKISAPAAWNVTTGENVVVAVSDTGVDTGHPDIAASMWTNPGEIPGNGIDDDGNGYVDDVNGWNFVANSNNVFDDFGHGTHVAGTIAADLDGDGQLEIIAAAEWEYDPSSYDGGPGAVYVWHADGTPMAGWPKYLSKDTYGTNRPTEFAVADVDGDGHPDLIGVVGDSVVVVDRNGQALPGWPQQWGYYGCYSGCADSVVAVADLDGDGKSEIAMVSGGYAAKQKLFLYSASGQLMPGFPRSLGRAYGFGASFTMYPFEQHNGLYVNAPVMTDLNGDGNLEIAALTDKMEVRAYRANGKRVYLSPRPKGLPNRQCFNWNGRGIASMAPILDPLTAGDLNGDGRAELLVGGHTKSWGQVRLTRRGLSVSLCPSLINSTDYINALHTGKVSPPGNWPLGISYPGAQSSYGPGSMAIGDIDGDGLPEVVSASGICGRHDGLFSLDNYRSEYRCSTINAYDRFGNLLPGFPKATPGPGSTNGMTPGIGDLAGDGLKEIVWIDWYGNVLVWDVPGTPAPEAMQWPMARHDAAHTGALTVLH